MLLHYVIAIFIGCHSNPNPNHIFMNHLPLFNFANCLFSLRISFVSICFDDLFDTFFTLDA